MSKFMGGILVVVGCAVVFACGSDDDDEGPATPVEFCKQRFAVACRKIFSCLTQAELDALAASIGPNSSECLTNFAALCTVDSTNCVAGQTYRSDKAQDCINSSEQLSCDELRRAPVAALTMGPAACSQVCQ